MQLPVTPLRSVGLAAGVLTLPALLVAAGQASSPAPLRTTSPTHQATALSVSTPAQLRSALSSARPGTTINVRDGSYQFRPRLVASANGTAAAPIVLQGSRKVVLESTGTGGDYGLSITGDYWRVQGVTVAHASKGIVLDGSVGTVLSDVQVYDIGAEGVHFRACSSHGVLKNSFIHGTGVDKPQFGEGVYVGSANSNWPQFSCHDGRDASENVTISGNLFTDIPAEGADLKEGTDSGTLTGNTFQNAGYSGKNSADSAVDVKGNNWLIEHNVVRQGSGAFLDAFQTHTGSPGYGTGNAFSGNTVEGSLPGYGFALYPPAANIVRCDNSAPGAARGLANVACRP